MKIRFFPKIDQRICKKNVSFTGETQCLFPFCFFYNNEFHKVNMLVKIGSFI